MDGIPRYEKKSFYSAAHTTYLNMAVHVPGKFIGVPKYQ